MLLGEVFYKKSLLDSNITVTTLYLKNMQCSDFNVCIDSLYNMYIERENYDRLLQEASSKIMVPFVDDKKIQLSKLISIKGALNYKINLINDLLSAAGVNFLTLLSVKNKTYDEYIYVASLIEKVMWSYEIDV